MALLDVQNLTLNFETRRGTVRAVRDVSFTLERGETLGIVGESGSGKSVSCLSLMGLLPVPPARIVAGSAQFEGHDLLKASQKTLRDLRGRSLSMIFQDPMTSLNPYLRVGTQLIEPLQRHLKLGRAEALKRAEAALEQVGIPEAGARLRAYPHEFSGGMRQRVMIAMAMITEPALLIADEPTTALDVTVQAQVLELIQERQRALNSAVILITHDLGVVAGLCDRINVMYAGQIVEQGTAEDIFYRAQHPYTIALQRSIPALGQRGEPLYTLPGLPPDLSKPLTGDPLSLRFPQAEPSRWQEEVPPLERVSDSHWVRPSDVVLPPLEEVSDGR